MPYPTEFPLSEVKYLYGCLKGSSTFTLKELHKVFYELEGYAASKYFEFSDGLPVIWGDYAPRTTHELKAALSYELGSWVEWAEGQQGPIDPTVVGAPNWAKLFQLLMKLLPLLLLEEGV